MIRTRPVARTLRAPAGVLVVTGTGTEVGKTAVTAAIAANRLAAGHRVALLKPAQTGVGADEPGDVHEAARLAGTVTARELVRYPDPLAPATAARRVRAPEVRLADVAEEVQRLRAAHDLVVVEGAGGLLVRFNEDGLTIADVAGALRAPVVVVARAGLGTLNDTALTAEALRARGLECAGVVVGSWPRDPDLADRCNIADLPEAAGAPLLGALPAGAPQRPTADFRAAARAGLAPALRGTWDAAAFGRAQAQERTGRLSARAAPGCGR